MGGASQGQMRVQGLSCLNGRHRGPQCPPPWRRRSKHPMPPSSGWGRNALRQRCLSMEELPAGSPGPTDDSAAKTLQRGQGPQISNRQCRSHGPPGNEAKSFKPGSTRTNLGAHTAHPQRGADEGSGPRRADRTGQTPGAAGSFQPEGPIPCELQGQPRRPVNRCDHRP